MGFPRFLGHVEKALYRFRLLSASTLTLPDFLCIGAQKAGTTWLYENLKLHPDIFLPPRKELHYFDWQYSHPLRFYSSQFEGDDGKVKGDITPGYGMLPRDRIKFIRAIMPDVKILMLLRNPVDRAWSHAVMGLRSTTGQPLQEVKTEEFIAHFRNRRSMGLGTYTRILAQWEAVFPRQQFFIGFFEDITADPKRLLTRVFEFLGVSTAANWSLFPLADVIRPHETRAELQAPPPLMPRPCREFLEEFYRDEIERLYRRFGEPVNSWRPGANPTQHAGPKDTLESHADNPRGQG